MKVKYISNDIFSGRNAMPNVQVRRSYKRRERDLPTMITELKKGYPVDVFDKIKSEFGVSQEVLSRTVNISLATIHRRKATKRLTTDESEKLYRLQRLYETAMEVFEEKESVRRWFNSPQVVFDGKTPLEYANTLPGYEEVERVLRRMEQGIAL